MSLAADIAAAVDAYYAHITASAAKRGRRPEWPYVPIVVYGPTEGCPRGYTQQIRARAYATRAEALAAAEQHIARGREALAADLADPRKRALREQHGLPRDLDPAR